MGIKFRRNAGHIITQAMMTEINRLRVAAVSTNVHACAAQSFSYDKDPVAPAALVVTAPNATDLPSSLLLGNQIIGFYIIHFADTLAHKAADATSLPAQGACVDLATSITAMTLLKATHATHIASTTVHYTADATNTLLTTTPSDQSSLNTFLNAAKTAINAHVAAALAGTSLALSEA